MSTETSQILSVLIVSNELEHIDRVQKVLKNDFSVNSHTATALHDVKNIINHEPLNLIVIDADENLPTVGVVKAALDKKSIPLLQLRSSGHAKTPGEFLKNGADLTAIVADELDILKSATALISSASESNSGAKSDALLEEYKNKFFDLYKHLDDPMCYVQDGLFLDANGAFMQAFEIGDEGELSELTIMDLVGRKDQDKFKSHMKRSVRRDMSATPTSFQMKSKLGKEIDMVVKSKPVSYENEPDVVQFYLRSESSGGGGAALYDETTRLAGKGQMNYYLKQKQEQLEVSGQKAVIAYLMIKNYRDIWGSDGYEEAEKFIKAISNSIRGSMPPRTEVARYTDDGLLLYIPELGMDACRENFEEMIKSLDMLTPEGMERMVEPRCYVGIEEFGSDDDIDASVSKVFRAARNAIISESSQRVSEPTAGDVLKKDTKRVEELQAILQSQRINMAFQPIVSFDPDGIERYRERISMVDEDGDEIELPLMISTGERYGLMREVDAWKIETLFESILAKTDRANLEIFMLMSADALKSAPLLKNLTDQMQQTGLGGKHFVFEFHPDTVQQAYTGAIEFVKQVRQAGAKVAVAKIGSMTAENERVVNDLKPNYMKLDINEISTLEDAELEEIMTGIQAKAQTLNATLIAEYIESPDQLSSIWPYGVELIQGDGMTPKLESLDFDFSSFAV